MGNKEKKRKKKRRRNQDKGIKMNEGKRENEKKNTKTFQNKESRSMWQASCQV